MHSKTFSPNGRIKVYRDRRLLRIVSSQQEADEAIRRDELYLVLEKYVWERRKVTPPKVLWKRMREMMGPFGRTAAGYRLRVKALGCTLYKATDHRQGKLFDDRAQVSSAAS